MCGFVGFSSFREGRFLKADLQEAVDSIKHRGPDDAGLFFNDRLGVGFGHRRLAVIDLSEGGHQPMVTDDRNLIIVYNGEVYNYKEIQRELEKEGCRFKSQSDTEVILKGYRQWGEGILQRLTGMFAFAIFDQRKKVLFLARDRVGIKPIFYYFQNNTFIFGSELKALMAFSVFPREVDPDSIASYLHYQYVPAPNTIFKNTWKLMPGHTLRFDGKHLNTKPYWHLPLHQATNSVATSEREYIDQLDALLTTAVKSHLVSDVPLGVLLSGGIDSSLVASIVNKVSRLPVKTYSIGFYDKFFNESPWAVNIASHLQTDHTELYVSSQDALATIPDLARVYDEPFADSSAIPTLLVSKLTRSQVTVALSGDGGDEQFSGYVRYWMTKSLFSKQACIPEALRRSVASMLEKIPLSTFSALYDQFARFLPHRFQVTNSTDKWQKLLGQMKQTDVIDLYRMTVCIWSMNDVLKLTGRPVQKGRFDLSFEENQNIPLLHRLMAVDQATYLPDAMLTKVDRASMASSLEIRVPLLDHRVVEFSARIPGAMHYGNGIGKNLLRKLLSRYLPEKLYARPKMGFGIPLAQWMRNELKPLVRDYLSPSHLKREGLFDANLVQNKIEAHESGLCTHHHRIWALLMWEMWRERWLN